MADALHVTQGNISNYERGQEVSPKVAKKLIAYAQSLGHLVSFDDIYGSPITPTRRASDPVPPSGHAGRQPPSPHNILDTLPEGAVVSSFITAKG